MHSFRSPTDLNDVCRQVDEYLAANGAVDVGAEAGTKKTVYQIEGQLYCLDTDYDQPPYTASIKPVNPADLMTNAELAQMAAERPVLVGRTAQARGW